MRGHGWEEVVEGRARGTLPGTSVALGGLGAN